jgi:hypothetical protein
VKSLYDRILEVLEAHASLCMDDEEEREELTQALVDELADREEE